MTKNVIYNIFYIAEYVAFILATIAVIVFQFTANEFLVICALVLYVIAFGIMTTNECIGVDYLKKSIKDLDEKFKASMAQNVSIAEEVNETEMANLEGFEVSKMPNETTADYQKELKEIRKQINWGYTKILLCAAFCIFAFVVLILF